MTRHRCSANVHWAFWLLRSLKVVFDELGRSIIADDPQLLGNDALRLVHGPIGRKDDRLFVEVLELGGSNIGDRIKAVVN